MYNNIVKTAILLLVCILFIGCTTTKIVTETRVEYVRPEIPETMLTACDPIPQSSSITTNGDLLMAYISLQSSYVICSLKVTSIANILKSYDSIYTATSSQETVQEDNILPEDDVIE